MSKVSFRARALDANRAMPVFDAHELSDLAEYAAINRTMPQMPTGMEKEEEMELHLQQAISAQQASCTGQTVAEQVVIPIPSVTSIIADKFNDLYPANFKPSKTLSKAQGACLNEPSIAYYDIDSEDEIFLEKIRKEMEITNEQFEIIMDRLENASERQVASMSDAKALVAADDDVIVTVYDYWLNKRLKMKRPLVTYVRCERKDGSTTFDPYVAFRRRGEKMQTRKNRKNDEESYEKILKLRQDLQRLVTLCDMVKRREKTKRELINMDVDIFECRFKGQDWTGAVYEQVVTEAKPSFQFNKEDLNSSASSASPKIRPAASKFVGRKRKHSRKQGVEADHGLVSKEWLIQNAEHWNRLTSSSPPIGSPVKLAGTAPSRDPVALLDTSLINPCAQELDGAFAFRRKRGCTYLPARGVASRGKSRERNGVLNCNNNRVPDFAHTYLHAHTKTNLLTYTGLTRRRVGRGGRILFDRLSGPSVSPPVLMDCHPSTSNAVPQCKKEETSQNNPYPIFSPANRLTSSSDVAPSDCVAHVSRPVSHMFYSGLPDQILDDATSYSDNTGYFLDTGQGMRDGDKRPTALVCGPSGSFAVPLSVGVSRDLFEDQRKQLRASAEITKKRWIDKISDRPGNAPPSPPPLSCIVDLECAHSAGAAVMPAPQAMRLVISKDREKTENFIEAQQTSNNNHVSPSVNGNANTFHSNKALMVNVRPPIRLQREPTPISRQNSERVPSPSHYEISYDQSYRILKGKSDQFNNIDNKMDMVTSSSTTLSPSSISPNSDASLPPVVQIDGKTTNGEIEMDHKFSPVKSLTKPVR